MTAYRQYQRPFDKCSSGAVRTPPNGPGCMPYRGYAERTAVRHAGSPRTDRPERPRPCAARPVASRLRWVNDHDRCPHSVTQAAVSAVDRYAAPDRPPPPRAVPAHGGAGPGVPRGTSPVAWPDVITLVNFGRIIRYASLFLVVNFSPIPCSSECCRCHSPAERGTLSMTEIRMMRGRPSDRLKVICRRLSQ
jgi:hypothetical protein